jgi:phospholipid/cholesterol/gamma-HCH transport system ATP-binding protein
MQSRVGAHKSAGECLGMIKVCNVTKRFGAQTVLDDISLEIAEGKTTAIVGPSGVGKSVLLKLILGIMSPDSGTIFIDGKEITKARSEAEKNDIRADVGVLFQAAALFDSLTIYQNVAFALKERKGMSTEEAHPLVVSILQSLSLTPVAGKLPQEVSVGVRKRAGLARALVTRPKIVLFDEPNTGLDPEVGQEVYDLIRECKEKYGFTGVVISHELPEVFQISDRVEMLLSGKVVASGTPEEFLASSSPYVSQFLHGRVEGPIKIS